MSVLPQISHTLLALLWKSPRSIVQALYCQIRHIQCLQVPNQRKTRDYFNRYLRFELSPSPSYSSIRVKVTKFAIQQGKHKIGHIYRLLVLSGSHTGYSWIWRHHC